MLKVLINIAFRDAYTGKLYEAGSRVEISRERATEIQGVDRNLITILGEVKTAPKKEEAPKKADSKKETAEKTEAPKKEEAPKKADSKKETAEKTEAPKKEETPDPSVPDAK